MAGTPTFEPISRQGKNEFANVAISILWITAKMPQKVICIITLYSTDVDLSDVSVLVIKGSAILASERAWMPKT